MPPFRLLAAPQSTDFEAVVSDVPIYRRGDTIPSHEKHACELLGAINFEFTRAKVPRIRRAVSFTAWQPDGALDDLVPEEHREIAPEMTADELAPTSADDHSCHLKVCQPLSRRWTIQNPLARWVV